LQNGSGMRYQAVKRSLHRSTGGGRVGPRRRPIRPSEIRRGRINLVQARRENVTEPGGLRNGLLPKVADEVEHVIGAFRDHSEQARQITVVPAVDGGIDHMYAEGEILVRDQHLDRVLEVIGHPSRQDLERNEPDRIRRVIGDHVLLTLSEPHAAVAEALDFIDEQLGRGIATPNHLLTVCSDGGVIICPATEPEPAYYETEPYPSGSYDGGHGVRIYVADTGLLRDAADGHAWLDGVEVQDEALDYDPPQPLQGSPPAIPPYTGHGTFVAGILRTMAPATDVIVTNVFSVAGSALESDFVARLETAFRLGVDIFQLDVACASRNDIPLLALGKWLKRVSSSKGAICLAPAGNSARRRPAWPAAFPEVIAVGALSGDWRGRASFSNFGPWVDVYAPGRDIVNAYATGDYTCHVSPYTGDVRSFCGMAKWSGTSFSTPIVSGLIADRMSRTGENARQAAEALLAEARDQAIPGVGPVLLPHR
jgi:subtilisin family serine protease